jgi:1-deoxy-D-xylulose-5-phosphate synthase
MVISMIDLEKIENPSFIKNLSIKELEELAKQIRQFLIENISKTGGHLSSNLGVVELTLAMYYVFDSEKDTFLFDVGHQSYVHKILTGRAKDFKTLRQFNGLSGYIKKDESKYDAWESGHSSTTISAMSGMIIGDENDSKRVISLIGDAAITNGVALEGLNFLGQMKNKNPIIILNDNKMGISKSVGALSKAFAKLRGKNNRKVRNKNNMTPNFVSTFTHKLKRGIKGFIQQDNIFEDLGFDYFGPYNGNDIATVIKVLKNVKSTKGPIIVHMLTKKGLGYELSENDKIGDFHGVAPFDIETGKPIVATKTNVASYSKIVADYLYRKREKKQFYVINPAMKSGSKLDDFAEKYKESFFDVGIAEEHATVMAAGLATSNKDVVLLMYSTFAQRAYDYILNDIARSDLKVVFGFDRAGVVGEDGSTHQGIYDVSMLSGMPNIKICAPSNASEVIELFNYALECEKHPIVVRYPRANTYYNINELDFDKVGSLDWKIINEGTKAIIISYGEILNKVHKVIKSNNLDVSLVNAICIKPLDLVMLQNLFDKNLPIIVIEEVINSGTLYSKILEYKEENNYSQKINKLSFNIDTIITHGKQSDVLDNYGMSNEDILKLINKVL